MRCISPLRLRQKSQFVVVPCGKCNFCLSNKRIDWTFRLLQELKRSNSAFFITLTYDNDHITPTQTLIKSDVQNFFKRLRKITDRKLRYYTVGEYGTVTQRPHYHSILFNLEPSKIDKIAQVWSKGLVHIGSVSEASIHYTTKYVINRVNDYPGREPPFALISKGIGSNYLTKEMIAWHKDGLRDYSQVNGIKSRLPRYLRDRIFGVIDKQLIALRLPELDVKEYWDEMERLSKYHADPMYYSEERKTFLHEAMLEKVNKSNKF